mmetsp:Transcript_20474/g.59334  ORF Transcript_20474/g.59334 Transcript_20474/m.59334 type:complete len:94 (-) Transcript_20474:60-341(-)|eukprot:CAMPEP_0168438136 /NCGR_PEP_ID=MMETSP0228-20121227/41806_1 /TAXON_ID=133427 /ORGANISM="Protoceratium reticulatum, Strain CCCM 535 (=CCMP 1889)" /LENGTH=93 /DNA_ID=CAMNT_0008452395 /DNA_START=48 /DNA_END=329 /DNA_ORIENTATION=+
MASFDFDLVEISLFEESSRKQKKAGQTGKAPVGWSAHKAGSAASPPVADRAAGGGGAQAEIPFVMDEGRLWEKKRAGVQYVCMEPGDVMVFMH